MKRYAGYCSAFSASYHRSHLLLLRSYHDDDDSKGDTGQLKRMKPFDSSTKFKLSPHQVNVNNCPTAAEVSQALPTLDELRGSLPTSGDVFKELPSVSEAQKQYKVNEPQGAQTPPLPSRMESKFLLKVPPPLRRPLAPLVSLFSFFGDHDKAVEQAVAENNTSLSSPNNNNTAPTAKNRITGEPLWPDADTPEDILNEEKFDDSNEAKAGHTTTSTAHEGSQNMAGSYVMLAWKALLYGSVLAVVFVTASVVAISWFTMGTCSLSAVMDQLQKNEEHRLAAIEEKARKEDGKYYHYNIDLTQPSTLLSQVDTVLEALETIAEEQAAEDASKKGV